MFEKMMRWAQFQLCVMLFCCIIPFDCVRLRHQLQVIRETSTVSPSVLLNFTNPAVHLLTNSTLSPTASSRSQISDDNDFKNAIYSPWSAWTSCSRKCKQERSRQCNVPRRCENIMVKEERSCAGRRCRKQPFTIVDDKSENREQTSVEKEQTITTLKLTLYSAWSEWSPCTRNCRTRRYRSCAMKYFCGTSAIQEDAFCYVKGTNCERTFKRLKKDKDSPNSRETREQPSSKTPYVKSPTTEECGTSNVTTDIELKIIGGQPVTKGKWPWQAAILNRFKEAFCGGTLIAAQWVLTAAHCLRKRLFVRLGEHDLGQSEGTEQEYRVANHFVHPDYDPETVDNDVALLKLSSPILWTKYVQLACLPKASSALPQDRLCVILGWGKETHLAVLGTEVLHQARVPIVDMKNCLEMYEDYYITKNMFCAGHPRGRVDSCAGDSGGPLLCEVNNRWHVYGITSFGEGCGRKGKYGIYAKVPNYIKWIEKTMEDNSDVL
ncbi:hypothetical protein CHUAL_013731 [Chamberlinius hualienensis]